MRAYASDGTEMGLQDDTGTEVFARSHLDPDVYPTQWVTMTAVGDTFSPRVELVAAANATVWWEVNGSLAATGTSPDFSFGTAATRTVRMGVTKHFSNRLDTVQVINLGFDIASDAGNYAVPSSYNHPSQKVTGISGLTACTNLKYFLAAHPVEYDGSSTGVTLAGHLDVSGLSKLEFIECYYASLDSVDLTGCTSLIRLVLEHNHVTNLDLNPVAANLKDLRCALMRGGSLTLAPLTQPLAQLYHFCVRDQTVNGFPTPAQLPVVNEMLVWNTGISSLTVRSSALGQVNCYLNPALTAVDCKDQFKASSFGRLNAYGSSISTVDVTNCPGIVFVDLRNNNLSRDMVDSILTTINAYNSSGNTIDMTLGANHGPSATGAAAADALRSRGWTVNLKPTE